MQVGNLGLLIVAMSVGAWLVVKPAMEERSYNNEKNVMIDVDRAGENTFDATIPEGDGWLFGRGDVLMPNKSLPEETCFAAVTRYFRPKDYVSTFELSEQHVFIHYSGLPSYQCDLVGENRRITEIGSGVSLDMTFIDSRTSTSQAIIEGKKRRLSHVWTKFSPNGRTYRGVLSETPVGMERMATLFEQ